MDEKDFPMLTSMGLNSLYTMIESEGDKLKRHLCDLVRRK